MVGGYHADWWNRLYAWLVMFSYCTLAQMHMVEIECLIKPLAFIRLKLLQLFSFWQGYNLILQSANTP